MNVRSADVFVRQLVRHARGELERHVKPRDQTERGIVNALGDISWSEAVKAIRAHRADVARPTSPDVPPDAAA